MDKLILIIIDVKTIKKKRDKLVRKHVKNRARLIILVRKYQNVTHIHIEKKLVSDYRVSLSRIWRTIIRFLFLRS